jgi:hypothetical protein
VRARALAGLGQSTLQAARLRRSLQDSGKRTASIIAKTAAIVISIHRDAFQHMIAGSDAALDADAELVPVSSGSTAARAFLKIRNMCGGGSALVSGSADTGSSPPSLEKKNSASDVSQAGPSPRPIQRQSTNGNLNLKDNFSASAKSRTDPSFHQHLTDVEQRSLLERAITAQVTMKAWCELRGMAPMAFVTMPIPEPLQALQVRVGQRPAADLLSSPPAEGILSVARGSGPRSLLPQVRLMESQVDEMRPKMMEWAGALERQETTVSVEIEDLGAGGEQHAGAAQPPSSAPTSPSGDAAPTSPSGIEFHPLTPGSGC